MSADMTLFGKGQADELFSSLKNELIGIHKTISLAYSNSIDINGVDSVSLIELERSYWDNEYKGCLTVQIIGHNNAIRICVIQTCYEDDDFISAVKELLLRRGFSETDNDATTMPTYNTYDVETLDDDELNVDELDIL